MEVRSPRRKAGVLQFSRDGILVTETGIPSVAPYHSRPDVSRYLGRPQHRRAIGNPGNAPLNLSLQVFQMDGTTQAGVANGRSLSIPMDMPLIRRFS